MFKRKNLMFLLVVLFSLCGLTLGYSTECVCRDGDDLEFPNYMDIMEDNPTSPDDVILEDINYGKLISVSGSLFLSADVKVKRSITSLSTSCPEGYRPPTNEEFQSLLALGYEFITDTMKMNSTLYYFTSVKAYPDITSGSNNNAWVYAYLEFDTDAMTVVLSNRSTYWKEDHAYTKCVREKGGSVVIKGMPTKDLVLYQDYKLSLDMTNIIAVYWEFGEESDSVQFKPASLGCNSFSVSVELFDGSVEKFCKTYWVERKKGSESPTTLSESDITSKYLDVRASSTYNLHFASGVAPIAPIASGGAYLAYSDYAEQNIHVLQLNASLDIIADFDIGSKGYLFDITEIPTGFAVLAKASHHLWIATYSKTGTLMKQVTIMNNGASPTKATDQITFWANSDSPVYGMNVCYNPHNGKLSYARGRIGVTYAHYNHFGFHDDGKRNDHTGDSFLVFDLNLDNVKLGWSWGASHSLTQRLVFDGEMFHQAGLGDAYPENIRFAFVKPTTLTQTLDGKTGERNRVVSSDKSNVISGSIPGTGTGKAAGRLGNIILYDGDDDYRTIYSRRASASTWTSVTNDVNELAMVKYTNKFTDKSTVQINKRNDITSIRATRYGSNIVISYTTTTEGLEGSYISASVRDLSTTSQYMMLIDKDGGVVTEPFKTKFSQNAGDDYETLSDGTVVWSFVNSTGHLSLYSLPTPVDICDSVSPPSYCYTVSSAEPTEMGTDGTDDNESIWTAQVNVLLMIVAYLLL